MTNLIAKTSTEIEDLLQPLVDHGYRGRQVANWVHQRGAQEFDEMDNLPKSLRAALEREFSLREPEILEICESGDGSAKFLLRFEDGVTVESVSMPEGAKATFCLSSQAGCAVGCTFCVTGAMGSGRNLSACEIVGQYRRLRRALGEETERVNIVFMGMGEPLLNTIHLEQALSVLYERVSPKRITVSTVGIIPGIEWLAALARRPKLAVSLNAPDQERREAIMPITRKYPLEELIRTIRNFPLERGRRITFEYVLIKDFNDAVSDASAVAKLIHGVPSKVNVIPLNEDADHFPELHQPSAETVDAFARTLRDLGHVVTVRWSKGADVAAACGQLKGRQPAR
ncbi:MAG: 23S rRNA (adenine(2503)-C(2))-methyltransferase RlmN [Thermoanaerobaculales bacterium]|nr:23S rRNA (adenine(2503)-C(2))-methyltransferase RlmN [Thermoanaerobaculales bacterium]